MTALLALIKVQIKLYLNNRRALLINIAMPILIGAFFGFVMGGSGGDDKPLHIKVAVVDQDQSELSTKIVNGLAGDANLDVQRIDETAAKDLVKNGKLKAALVLPKGFGDKAARGMFGGDKIELPLYYDPSEKMALGMLRGLLAQYTMQQVMTSSFSGANGQKLLDDAVARVEQDPNLPASRRASLSALFKDVRQVQQEIPVAASGAASDAASSSFKGMSPPYTLNEQGLTAGLRGYNGFAHSFAGMGAQFVLFMSINLGMDILLARRSGMWLRLRAAPLSKATLLGSYFFSTALIASVVLAVVMLAGMVLFHFGISSPVGFALVIMAYGLFTAGFGLFLSAIGGSPEATRGLATMAVLLMVMLGGAWVPSFIFPEWMQQLTLVVPVRWAIDGLEAMTWRGLGLQTGALAAAVLTGFALLFAALAWWRFDWRE